MVSYPQPLNGLEESEVTEALKALRLAADLIPQEASAFMHNKTNYMGDFLALWIDNCNLQIRCLCLEREGKYFWDAGRKLVDDVYKYRERLYILRERVEKDTSDIVSI
jgi:hypothetical protein